MDVVVFCLALMGTDYPSFLREATRVLKSGGKLWIAEVRSRFVHNGRESFQPFLDATQGSNCYVSDGSATHIWMHHMLKDKAVSPRLFEHFKNIKIFHLP
jgi:ubiquinone/menaquinone biosynthesis C-methylase UbiE